MNRLLTVCGWGILAASIISNAVSCGSNPVDQRLSEAGLYWPVMATGSAVLVVFCVYLGFSVRRLYRSMQELERLESQLPPSLRPNRKGRP